MQNLGGALPLDLRVVVVGVPAAHALLQFLDFLRQRPDLRGGRRAQNGLAELRPQFLGRLIQHAGAVRSEHRGGGGQLAEGGGERRIARGNVRGFEDIDGLGGGGTGAAQGPVKALRDSFGNAFGLSLGVHRIACGDELFPELLLGLRQFCRQLFQRCGTRFSGIVRRRGGGLRFIAEQSCGGIKNREETWGFHIGFALGDGRLSVRR